MENKLRGFLKSLFSFVIFCLVKSNPGFSQEVSRAHISEKNFSLSGYLEFFYVDAINLASSQQKIIPSLLIEDKFHDSTTSSLGLSRAQIDFSWQRYSRYYLNMTMRPDALMREEQISEGNIYPREIDRRAGDSYRPSSSIRLLDTYDITINMEDQFVYRLGVLENLVSEVSAYNSILDFGLKVEFPEKFFGMQISLNSKSSNQDEKMEAKPSYNLDLTVFEGRDDRMEAQTFRSKIDTKVSSAQDPYRGLAAAAYMNLLENMQLGLMFGYVDNEVFDYIYREQFGDFSVSYLYFDANTPLRFALDMRLASEKVSGSEQRPTLRQQSIGATISANFRKESWLIFGFHFGKSERINEGESSEKDEFSGLQFDIGVIREITKGFDVKFALANEERNINFYDGTTKGAFEINNRPEKRVQRLGLEVSYKILD